MIKKYATLFLYIYFLYFFFYINSAVRMAICSYWKYAEMETSGSNTIFWQHIEFGDCPSTTSHEFKPPCRQTSFNTTLNLYQLQGCSPVTDPALSPCCEKKISPQGSIKCHISTVMHSRGE